MMLRLTGSGSSIYVFKLRAVDSERSLFLPLLLLLVKIRLHGSRSHDWNSISLASHTIGVEDTSGGVVRFFR